MLTLLKRLLWRWRCYRWRNQKRCPTKWDDIDEEYVDVCPHRFNHYCDRFERTERHRAFDRDLWQKCYYKTRECREVGPVEGGEE